MRPSRVRAVNSQPAPKDPAIATAATRNAFTSAGNGSGRAATASTISTGPWMKNAAKNGTKLVVCDPRLSDLTRRGAVLLVFVSAGCGSCRPVIERIPRWATDLAPVRVIGVVTHPIAATIAVAPGLEGHLMHDVQGATIRTFGVATPGAVLLGGDGLLAGGPVVGGHEVIAFVEEVRAELLEAGVIGPA